MCWNRDSGPGPKVNPISQKKEIFSRSEGSKLKKLNKDAPQTCVLLFSGLEHDRKANGGNSESASAEHGSNVHKDTGVADYTDQRQENSEENLCRREAETRGGVC